MNLSTLYAGTPSVFTTFSGRRVDLSRPDPDSISSLDIAHHLSGTPRYGGALADGKGHPVIYTVAEHCLYVMAAALEGGPASFTSPEQYCKQALHALLHDATEAYCGDAIGPLKTAMRSGLVASHYDAIETELEAAIHVHFGLMPDEDVSLRTKRADIRVYAAESVALRRWGREDFATHGGGVALFDDRWMGRIWLLEPAAAKSAYWDALRPALLRDPAAIEAVVESLSR